ncbi:MAG TPA: hypothetical protein VFW78_06315 [Bacteroidia bacterium]|nr:hypothetical protein [Bacteroidia bacterium]
MKKIKVRVVAAFLLLLSTASHAQERIITAGFQFRPLFSSGFFNGGPVDVSDKGVSFHLEPHGGSSFGMIIRKGFTNTLSMETGINYTKRSFNMSVTDSAATEASSFSIIGYEIPVSGLVFIQLSDKIYMDVSLGFSFDFYPSDIRTTGTMFSHYSARKAGFSPSVTAGLGWEYRTEKSGYFYVGASYHRPFDYIYYSYFLYPDKENPTVSTGSELQGNYLAVDFKYFFHSEPQKKKKKQKKPDKRTK